MRWANTAGLPLEVANPRVIVPPFFFVRPAVRVQSVIVSLRSRRITPASPIKPHRYSPDVRVRSNVPDVLRRPECHWLPLPFNPSSLLVWYLPDYQESIVYLKTIFIVRKTRYVHGHTFYTITNFTLEIPMGLPLLSCVHKNHVLKLKSFQSRFSAISFSLLIAFTCDHNSLTSNTFWFQSSQYILRMRPVTRVLPRELPSAIWKRFFRVGIGNAYCKRNVYFFSS